jgi:hypothetical protein
MQKEMIDKQKNPLYNTSEKEKIEKLTECYRKLKSLGLAIAKIRGKNTQIEININPDVKSVFINTKK